MKKVYVTLIVLHLVLYFSCATKDSRMLPVSQEAVLVLNADFIDVVSGEIQKNKTILIDSGRIQTISETNELSDAIPIEKQIDAAGKYIIPGLWDMHVHLEGADLIEDNELLLPVYIAYGITTIRDAASDLGEQVLVWRDEIENGEILGPRIFTAGRKLEGINSIWKGDLEIANEQELHQMLDTLEGYNVDFVKITENTLSGELFLASVLAAKERGFLVSGHIPYDLTIRQLAEAGLSSIEHASYMLRLGSDELGFIKDIASGTITKDQANEDYLQEFDQERALQGYTKLAKTGIALTPTLIGGRQLAYLDTNDHQSDPFLVYLTKRFTSNYQWRIDRMANETPHEREQRKHRYVLIANQLPFIEKAGILILAGSDSAALNTFVYPALALHEELQLFQEAGLTPAQILRSATVNGAKFMGKSATMGTISEGMVADLVLLNENPLKDIGATQDIYGVIRNGNYYDRNRLNTLLKQAEHKRTQLDMERE